MRPIKFHFFKGNVFMGEQELNAGGIIDMGYEWDTACQFTGLLDKNGEEIWEGDILKHLECPTLCVVTFEKSAWRYKRNWSLSAPVLLPEFSKYFEVIGNVYQNPELLEEKP